MSEKCDHCKRLIVSAAGRWAHAQGINWGREVCHVNGRSYQAHPHGEECRVGCYGHWSGLQVVKW